MTKGSINILEYILADSQSTNDNKRVKNNLKTNWECLFPWYQ